MRSQVAGAATQRSGLPRGGRFPFETMIQTALEILLTTTTDVANRPGGMRRRRLLWVDNAPGWIFDTPAIGAVACWPAISRVRPGAEP